MLSSWTRSSHALTNVATVGTKLVAVAAERAKAAGCEWLHVDFEDHLGGFYFGSCGFKPTNAGLVHLKGD
jgi:hypothetical protein